MNVELIRKYEKEFLHMLHGGKLKYFTGKEWLTYSGVELWTASNDLKIIIDDQYVEFRKALADGKTIEERYYTPTDHWGKHLSGFAISPKMLRIKPEEPEFKIGDYVRYIHANSPKPLQISNINCERYYFENSEIILRVDEIEKWEPQVGEWCTLPNGYNGFTVSKFISKEFHNDVKITLAIFENGETSDIVYVEPFIGTLPTHLKDNK